MFRGLTSALFLIVVLACPVPANSQHIFESVGSRALGMGGAFVGVADDASGVYWNPAGLVSGQPVGGLLEWNWLRLEDADIPPAAGLVERRSNLTSFGSWPLGLSFTRIRTTRLYTGPADGLEAETLETRDFGVTILQTLVPGLVVGSTLKYVRGGTSFEAVDAETAGDALTGSADAERESSGAFDLDLAFMADMTYVRVGLTLKNLRQPEFGESAETAITLPRMARLGISVLPTAGLTLAMDVDLNTVDLRDGRRRMIALGGESHLGGRLAVRGGVRWNREGAREPVATAGGSVQVRSGLWIDGHYAHSQDRMDRGFGFALRAGY